MLDVVDYIVGHAPGCLTDSFSLHSRANFD